MPDDTPGAALKDARAFIVTNAVQDIGRVLDERIGLLARVENYFWFARYKELRRSSLAVGHDDMRTAAFLHRAVSESA